jgi:hypothetical protein
MANSNTIAAKHAHSWCARFNRIRLDDSNPASVCRRVINDRGMDLPEHGLGRSCTSEARMAETQRSPIGETTERSGGIVNRVKESATAQLTNQKNRGTDALGQVANAVRSSTQKLRDEQHHTIAGYIDQAADQIDHWSRRLRDKDIDELMSDVQQLARRQPAVFIGSAFALGLTGARFFKSSRPQNEYNYGNESRRTRYRGDTRPSTVHDYSAGDREGESVVASEIDVAGVEIDPLTPSAGGAEPGSRSTRARRSPTRTGQS